MLRGQEDACTGSLTAENFMQSVLRPLELLHGLLLSQLHIPPLRQGANASTRMDESLDECAEIRSAEVVAFPQMQSLTFRLLKCQTATTAGLLSHAGAEQAVGYQDKDSWSIFLSPCRKI